MVYTQSKRPKLCLNHEWVLPADIKIPTIHRMVCVLDIEWLKLKKNRPTWVLLTQTAEVYAEVHAKFKDKESIRIKMERLEYRTVSWEFLCDNHQLCVDNDF